MRIPLIAGNWKMNTMLDEAVALVHEMAGPLDRIDKIEKVICPPFISLAKVSDIIRDTTIGIGAQNMYFEEKGAFTGEISPNMLKGLCDFVIIGHSERRQYFNESNQMINKKIKAAYKAGLAPIFCIGERLEEKEGGKTEQIVTDQLVQGLDGVPAKYNLVVAYEPVWAIGTGRAANGTQAQNTIKFIRDKLENLLGQRIAYKIRILYGGSVTASNIVEFASQADIDGALVGGACLKANEFISIAEQLASTKIGLSAG